MTKYRLTPYVLNGEVMEWIAQELGEDGLTRGRRESGQTEEEAIQAIKQYKLDRAKEQELSKEWER